MSISSPPRPITREIRFEPLGGNKAIMDGPHCRAPEILLSGPAGTGKSRACLEKLNACAIKYPGMRGLILRKTRVSLTQSALVTFEKKVCPQEHGARFNHDKQAYIYPNGSEIGVGGLDRDSRVMSREYDIIYPQEATELTESDWESLTSRLRYGVMPYQQLLGDCNPDTSQHWLKLRGDAGNLVMIESRHEDNPTVTPEYLATLDRLTGVRYLRLRLGIWAAAEGMVYDGWDRNIHLIDGFPIPQEWPRYWAVDFGYTNPFVWQAWAQDPDGRLYRYREIYQSQRLVEDMAKEIQALTKDEPRPRAVVCDHDAEGRATLERHLGIKTVAAKKTVTDGIQVVASRLRKSGNGQPRLFLLRDALNLRDPEMLDKRKPTCTEEEFEGYVWDRSNNRKKGEEPVKNDDHGMDCIRYLVMHFDAPGPSRHVVSL